MKNVSERIEFYAEALADGKVVRIPLVRGRDASVYSARFHNASFFLKYRTTEESKNGVRFILEGEADLNGSADGYAFGAEIFTDLPPIGTKLFSPSCWYGSAENCKFPFLGEYAGGGVDSLSAPVAGIWHEGSGFVLTDLTEGRRQTAEGDSDASESKNLVSSHFDFPSIGVRKNKILALWYRYPAATYSFCGSGAVVNRFIDRKNCKFSFRVDRAEAYSFEEFSKNAWRTAYKAFAKIDETIDISAALNAVINHTVNSYGERNGIAQFMVNADHFVPESGFLYRNADLAALLLSMKREGFSVPISDERCIRVTDEQVKREYAGKNQFFAFWRSRFEGVHSVYRAYRLLKNEGIEKKEWLGFVLGEAEIALSADECFSVPLLCELYRDMGEKKYLSAARDKCEKVWNEYFSKGRFYGGIVDFIGEPSLDKESGIAGMDAFLSLYAASGERENLERARRCADYTETYHQLQDIDLEPFGLDDGRFHAAGKGNSHVSARGLGFIANTCAAGDIAGLLAAGRYAELSVLVADPHYADFARLLYRNVYLSVNLFDKAGSMADALYSSGAGFINEYIQMGISCDPVGLGRGMAHDSGIAWCPYTILKAALELRKAGYTFSEHAKERYRELTAVSFTKGAESLFDGDFSTLFDGAGKTAEVSFGRRRLVDKIVFAFCHDDEACEITLSCLIEGKAVKTATAAHDKGFYEVVSVGVEADAIKFSFGAAKIILKQVQIFGVDENKLISRNKADGVSFVELCLGGQTEFSAEGVKIPFNNGTNSYLTQGVEFLQKGVLRINRKKAECKFVLPRGYGIFSFAPERTELSDGNVRVEIWRAGETVFETSVGEQSVSFKGETGGETELRFSCVGKKSLRFGFYAERVKDKEETIYE